MQINSKKIKPGDKFICLPKGEQYIEEALANGASEVIKMSHEELASYAKKIFHNPSKHLKTIGITGTNGKTSVGYFTQYLLNKLGQKAAFQGTITQSLTTPDILETYAAMSEHLSNGGTHFIMEASSHGIDQHRVTGIEFYITCLTNITPEHLDYHVTFEAYKNIKINFMKRGQISIFPEDFESVSLKNNPFTGGFLLKNLQAATKITMACGYSLDEIEPHLVPITPPPGRYELLPVNQPFKVIVDYAHTSDALEKLLIEVKKEPDLNRLILVFGCGGDRDRLKRPVMGKIAQQYADKIFVTNDNPRSEDPNTIIEEILSGMTKSADVSVIPDRDKAITAAIADANENDIVVLAGKGHEKIQILKEGQIPFDDKAVALKAMKLK